MSEQQETTEEITAEKVKAVWVFGGTGLTSTYQRRDVWYPLPADLKNSRVYEKDTKNNHILTPGSEYEVAVVNNDDGSVSLYESPRPRYLGRHDNAEFRAAVEARHKAAETELRLRSMAARDKRESALAEALDPITAISRDLHPTERTAFAAYVLQCVMQPWARKSEK
jgi:hypothetical protein